MQFYTTGDTTEIKIQIDEGVSYKIFRNHTSALL